MSVPPTISHAVQQMQEWLKELEATADLSSEKEALSVLRAVLHQLRDRLTVDESVQFAAQLPLIVRGIYYEGWQPRHVPNKEIGSREDFLDALTVRLLPHRLPPEPITQSVFALLAHHLDPGEISDVIGQLPDDIKGLWPLTARTFKERMR
jgi:uncharacterized protein (DUF2267 family)